MHVLLVPGLHFYFMEQGTVDGFLSILMLYKWERQCTRLFRHYTFVNKPHGYTCACMRTHICMHAHTHTHMYTLMALWVSYPIHKSKL